MTKMQVFAGFQPGSKTKDNPMGVPLFISVHRFLAGARRQGTFLGTEVGLTRKTKRGRPINRMDYHSRENRMRPPTGNRERARHLRQQGVSA